MSDKGFTRLDKHSVRRLRTVAKVGTPTLLQCKDTANYWEKRTLHRISDDGGCTPAFFEYDFLGKMCDIANFVSEKN